MDDLQDKSVKAQPAKQNESQIGAWEEVAEEEDFFAVNKVIEKEDDQSGVLGKRPYLLFETEQESDLADIKQMKKRVEQNRVEVYKKEVYQDADLLLPSTSGFKKRQKKATGLV